MSKTFLISDTHFGHANILKFQREDGAVLRDFYDVHHMDQYMIDRWNSVVNPDDKVYHLGDVTFKNTYLDDVMPRLNGTKVLIKGNHDTLKPNQYLKYFKDVRAYWVLDKFVLSHIPIHPESLSRWKANIHGHLHYKTLEDSRYFNVSVEQHNYTPVDFELIREYYSNVD